MNSTVDDSPRSPEAAGQEPYLHPEAGETHLRDYLHVLRKHFWVILLFFTVVVAATAVATFRMAPVYRARAVLEISPPKAGVSLEELMTVNPFQREYFQTLVQRIRMREVVEPIWREFGSENQTFDSFADSIETEPKRDTNLVEVTLEGEDPLRITKIVDKVTTNFLVWVFEDMAAFSQTTRETAGTQAQSLTRQIQDAQAKLDQFLREREVPSSLENEVAIEKGNLAEIRSQHEKARTEMLEIEAKFLQIQTIDAEGGDYTALPFVSRDQDYRQRRDQLDGLERSLQELNSQYGPNHPQIQALTRQRDTASQQLLRTVDSLVDEVRNDYAIQSRFTADLAKSRQELEEKVRKLDNDRRDYDLLVQDLERLKDDRDRLFKLNNELGSGGALSGPAVRIREPAVATDRPVKPRKLLNLALACLVGLFGGVMFAFFLEYLDDSIKTPDDVERYLHLPLLGVIPDMAEDRKELASTDLVAHTDPRSTISEAYRAIRTSLTYASATDPLRTLLVTSAGPGEGKTTNAVNLAIAFAQSGARTLLVDADMRRPRIHKIFDLENPSGLSSWLARGRSVEEVVSPTQVPNLFVVPTGPIPPNPAEMLGSPRMRQFLADVASRYDRVVLDSPPTAAVTDACVLGPLLDGVVQVVLAGATSRKLVGRGRTQIQGVGARHLGLILNGVKTRRHGYDYYYSGYYYYRYYGDRKEKHRRKGEKSATEPAGEAAASEAAPPA